MRIYADSLKPNIPYKTILLSTRDTADFAVVEALEKYGLEKENPREYCIARVTMSILLQTLHLVYRHLFFSTYCPVDTASNKTTNVSVKFWSCQG